MESRQVWGMLQFNFYAYNLTSRSPGGLRQIDLYRAFPKSSPQLHSAVVLTVLTVRGIIAFIVGMLCNYGRGTSALAYLDTRLVTSLWPGSEDWPHLIHSGWYSSDLSLGMGFVPLLVGFHKESDYWTIHPRLSFFSGEWVSGIDEVQDKICFILKKVPLRFNESYPYPHWMHWLILYYYNGRLVKILDMNS